MSTRGLVLAGVSLVMAAASTVPAAAEPYLPGLTNLNFTLYTGAAPKEPFTVVDPVGWTGGSGLIYIDSPSGNNQAASSNGGGIQTYGNPSPNLPGNYVEADGNPSYESGFSYTVNNLTPGQSYELVFYQAASQQNNYGNNLNTTERWIVSLGTYGLTTNIGAGPADPYYGGNDSTYSNADPNADVQATNLMTTPSGGTVPWQQVTLSLTADSTTDLLSFLAWGDNGSTVNLPPIVFLTGVDTPNLLVPEPAALSILGAGVLALGGIVLRRRGKRTAAT